MTNAHHPLAACYHCSSTRACRCRAEEDAATAGYNSRVTDPELKANLAASSASMAKLREEFQAEEARRAAAGLPSQHEEHYAEMARQAAARRPANLAHGRAILKKGRLG